MPVCVIYCDIYILYIYMIISFFVAISLAFENSTFLVFPSLHLDLDAFVRAISYRF